MLRAHSHCWKRVHFYFDSQTHTCPSFFEQVPYHVYLQRKAYLQLELSQLFTFSAPVFRSRGSSFLSNRRDASSAFPPEFADSCSALILLRNFYSADVLPLAFQSLCIYWGCLFHWKTSQKVNIKFSKKKETFKMIEENTSCIKYLAVWDVFQIDPEIHKGNPSRKRSINSK